MRRVIAASQSSILAFTRSRAASGKASSAKMTAPGVSAFGPGDSLATGSPSQRMTPSFESTIAESTA